MRKQNANHKVYYKTTVMEGHCSQKQKESGEPETKQAGNKKFSKRFAGSSGRPLGCTDPWES